MLSENHHLLKTKWRKQIVWEIMWDSSRNAPRYKLRHEDQIFLKFRIKDSLVHLAVGRVLITERFYSHSTGETVPRYRPRRTGPYRIWFQFFKHVIALRGNRFKSQTPRGWTSGGERTDFTTICLNEHTSVHPSLHGQEQRWPALSLWSPSSVRDKVYMKSTLFTA